MSKEAKFTPKILHLDSTKTKLTSAAGLGMRYSFNATLMFINLSDNYAETGG